MFTMFHARSHTAWMPPTLLTLPPVIPITLFATPLAHVADWHMDPTVIACITQAARLVAMLSRHL